MTALPNLITVFRSDDGSSRAEEVRDLLRGRGIAAELFTERDGLTEGVIEVRVPSEDSGRAEELIGTLSNGETYEAADPSHDLDSVAVYEGQGTVAEVEAMNVKSVLDSAGIPATIIGSSTMPNLEFFVRVNKDDVQRAQGALVNAASAGPEAAMEAEKQSETRGS